MGLKQELKEQGEWLFRWRSYLPLVFIVPLVIGVATMRWPFESYPLHEVWEFVCLTTSLLGVTVRVLTVGHTPARTSGRNTKTQVADELNTTGIYSTVRHPLYFGNFLIGLGVVMLPFELWLGLLYTLSFWLYYERIMFAEESFISKKFGEEYSAWAQRTPVFVPNPWLWTKPSLKFSLRNVLRREYTALALTILLHALVETAEHLVIEHRFKFEPAWAVLLALTVALYFVLRAMKRRTSLLSVEGR